MKTSLCHTSCSNSSPSPYLSVICSLLPILKLGLCPHNARPIVLSPLCFVFHFASGHIVPSVHVPQAKISSDIRQISCEILRIVHIESFENCQTLQLGSESCFSLSLVTCWRNGPSMNEHWGIRVRYAPKVLRVWMGWWIYYSAEMGMERQTKPEIKRCGPTRVRVDAFHASVAWNSNPLSAIWWIYPSSKWSSQWPYDGYIRHGWMTSCGRGRDLATRESLGRGSWGTIFVRSSKLSLFFPEIWPFRRVFLFPALLKDLAPNVQALGLLVSTMSWRSFWKLRSVTGHFLRTPTTTMSNVWKFSFFFPKSRCYFPDSDGDPQAEQSTLVMVRQKLEWKLDRPPALVRSSAEGPSIVVAIGTSRVRWSIVQIEKKKKTTTKPASDRAMSQPFIIYKPGSFEQPVFETRCHNRFALRCYRVR